MTHPAGSCPEAARLLAAVHQVCALHNGSFAVVRIAEIERERQGREWQAAWDAYAQHIQNCVVCQKAIRAEEER